MDRELLLNIQAEIDTCLQDILSNNFTIETLIMRVESCISALSLDDGSPQSTLRSLLQQLQDTSDFLLDLDEYGGAIRTNGRPRINIPKEKLEYLLSLKFKVPHIAKMLGVSNMTIFRRFRQYELSVK